MEASIGELIQEGLKLMLIGMGIVYLFLMLLVWIINVSYSVIRRFDLDETLPPQEHPVWQEHLKADDESLPAEDAELVAVISAAIQNYQNQ